MNKREDGTYELTQKGLTDRVIAPMGLQQSSNTAWTPAEKSALGDDLNGEPCQESFNYASGRNVDVFEYEHTARHRIRSSSMRPFYT